MKPALALLALGLMTLIAQGAITLLISPPYCPDFALLFVIAVGLRWEGLGGGLCIAAFLGYAADLLSGSLFGQHALLRIFTFIAARVSSRQLNLRGSFPLAVFTAGASLAYSLATLVLGSFFAESVGLSWGWLADSLRHAPINALFAPPVALAVEKSLAWFGEDDAFRRPLRLEARRRPA